MTKFSVVLLEDNYELRRGMQTMTFCRIYNLSYHLEKTDYNQTEYNATIDFLKQNGIQYLLYTPYFISEYNNGSLFVSNFYNETIYQCGRFNISYAPYFN